MKKLYFLLVVSFLLQTKLFAQKGWVSQSSGTETGLNSVFFQDQFNGWIVGDSGILLRTTDGGETWISQKSNTNVVLKSVFFIDKNYGWIVGSKFSIPNRSSNVILRTTDGGNQWKLDSLEWLPSKIFFVDKNIGWTICSNAEIYPNYHGIIIKTTDGGISWFHQTDGTQTSSFDDLNFIDKNKGWVVGHLNSTGTPVLLKTTNGGNDWITQQNNWDFPLFSVCFTDSNDGFLVGEGGLILNTTDGGSFWNEQSSGTNQNLFDVYFINDSTGWAVGSDAVIIGTTDGGNSWRKQSEGKTTILNSVFFADKNKGWAVGSNGTILHTSNDGVPSQFSYFPLSPGNKWFFSQGFDGKIQLKLVVEKDTLLNDGYIYAKLNLYDNFNNCSEGWGYLRNDSNKIIQYPDILLLDFKMQLGDTVFSHGNHTPAVLNDIELDDVFNRYLSTYYFFATEYDYYSYTDSIGFNTLWATNFRNLFPELLLGCEIDDKVYGIITTIKEEKELVTEFKLYQNYPNPFNPATKIEYSIPKTSFVTLKVYDILGREVATLVNEEKSIGNYNVEFNGNGLSSGIYFYKFQAGDYTSVKKMNLVK